MTGNFIDFYPSLLPVKTAVSLVAHGLNQKPDAMLSLVSWMTKQGSDVYLVKLSGHHKGGRDIQNVTASVWQKEMLEGYQLAKRASLDAAVPIFFLGYSLGALLGQSMAVAMDSALFDKQVLIAPAIAIRSRSYLIKLLFFFGKQRHLPSFTPREYRVNKSLPLLIYDYLFTEERKILKSGFNKLNIPTLIIIDPKDELVSYKKLLQLISRFGLSNYRVVVLDDVKERSGAYHHLIVDEKTMGPKNWKMATGAIGRFLFGDPG